MFLYIKTSRRAGNLLMNKILQNTLRRFLMVICVITLTACSPLQTKKATPTSDAELYNMGKQALKNDDYQTAIDNFKQLNTQYPFGPFAEMGQLDLAYAYMKGDDPQNAHAVASQFVRLHSDHPNIDYAYYLKGLASYFSARRFIERYLPVDKSERDPGELTKAFEEFAYFVKNFPNSPYANDAHQRMIAIKNRMAKGILNIANYYLKRHAYIAAINRGNEIVKHYQQTPYVEPALGFIIEGYKHLELDSAANDAIAVLKKNFPHTELLNSEGKFVGYQVFNDVNPSILDMASFGLFKGKVLPAQHHKIEAQKPLHKKRTKD